MEFRVLGDLEVRRDGAEIPLGPRQQRAVLGLLVLNAGEVVPVDRIVDELWGEAPPPTAAKTVHVYVSRLRKALGDGSGEAIVTRDHGYVLRVDPDDVDALRFERLLDEGRRAFAGGDSARASEVLSAALALWRGPPLGLAFEAGERANVARLEELRLEALETRVDADLALGRHDRLVPELELLAARDPLRERLHRQRMLALYRCDRQPDALAVYRETRARLVDELGIEPSAAMRELHDAMLRQDPALDVVVDAGGATEPAATQADRARAGPPVGRSRGRLTAVLAAVALVAGVAVVVTLLARSTGAPPAVRIPANAVGVLDPRTGRLVATASVGLRPSTPVEAGGSVWVANLDDATVTRIDESTQRLLGLKLPGGSVTGIAAGGGAVWVGDATDALVRRLETALGTVTRTIPLRGGRAGPSQSVDAQEPIAFGGGSVWVAHSGVITRLDAHGGSAVTIPVGIAPAAIAVGAGAAWVTDSLDDNVLRIVDDAVVTRIPVGGGVDGIAVGDGAVWVARRHDGTVARIDPRTQAITNTIDVGREPRGVAIAGHDVWVANSGDGTLSQIDTRTRRVVHTLPVGNSPTGIAAIGGRVWVTVQPPRAAVASAPGPPRAGVLRVESSSRDVTLDPALADDIPSWQILYAACAKLYNYPDTAGAAGARILPEVARGPPQLSRGGLRQTFVIRPGFRLSPPSGAPVTAQTFRHAIERSVDPILRGNGPATGYLDDVVGVRAFEHRRAAHIAGVTASGDRLVIRTTRPAPDLMLRLSMPFFCAVPDDAPARPGGAAALPTAGPYYIRSTIPGRQIVLARNPYYHGSRRPQVDAIDVRLGTGPITAVDDVAAGTADYHPAPGGSEDLPLGVGYRLEARYGAMPGSGHARYFVNEQDGGQYLSLNTARPLFAHARMRRAVSFAIDRAALAAQAGLGAQPMAPTDQYLPPSIPGFRDVSLYPLHGDLARARRLAGPGRRRANLLVLDAPPFTDWAAIVRANLARIGVDVTIQAVPYSVFVARIGHRDAGYDMVFNSWFADFPDPQQFLAFQAANNSFFDDPSYDRRLDAAARSTGAARIASYARLDTDLAGKASPMIAFGVGLSRDLFSSRVGCQVFQPAAGGMDLAALCLRHR